MKCKKARRRIIELSGENRESQEESKIHAHLSQCERCGAWVDDLTSLREQMKHLTEPIPSHQIVEKTRRACHDQLVGASVLKNRVHSNRQPQSLPEFIKWVLPPLMLFTIGWILWHIGDLEPEISLTSPAVFSLFLIIQNGVMLLLAPVLLRRFRPGKLSARYRINHR